MFIPAAVIAGLCLALAGVLAWKRTAACSACPVSRPFRLAKPEPVKPIVVAL